MTKYTRCIRLHKGKCVKRCHTAGDIGSPSSSSISSSRNPDCSAFPYIPEGDKCVEATPTPPFDPMRGATAVACATVDGVRAPPSVLGGGGMPGTPLGTPAPVVSTVLTCVDKAPLVPWRPTEGVAFAVRPGGMPVLVLAEWARVLAAEVSEVGDWACERGDGVGAGV